MKLVIGLWMLVALATAPLLSFSHETGKCLTRRREPNNRRHVYVGERTVPIAIETSSRITHQVSSHILRILLKEVIGYTEVSIVRKQDAANATAALQRISGCYSARNCVRKAKKREIPETMINLEVWVPPAFNLEEWVATGLIEDCGPLGPIGRSGWYVPEFFVHEQWTEHNLVIDHWKAFRLPEIVAKFDLTKEKGFKSWTVDSRNHSFYCSQPLCESGIYSPPQCRKPGTKCATLIADYPEMTFNVLRQKVDDLDLLVRIAWVGPHLDQLVQSRTTANKPTLFFNWKPNTLTSWGNFTDVALPHCEDSPLHHHSKCDYGVSQINKVAWSRLKTSAPYALHVIRALTFTQSQYLSILRDYAKAKIIGQKAIDVACLWVRQNERVWHEWIPSNFADKTTLIIGGIFPKDSRIWNQAGVIPAAQLAVDAINRNNSILEHYTLELQEHNGRCESDMVMKSFISYVTSPTYDRLVGILGPACSETVEPIAGVAKHFNTIIISYSAEGALFSNREKYPFFFRTIPENNLFRFVYLNLFLQLGWHRAAALTEDGQKYPEYLSLLQDMMQGRGMNFITNRKFPRERKSDNMTQYLSDLKSKNARIIIGDFYDSAARAVMCEAYKQGMTAQNGYQWFLPMWYAPNWYDTEYYNTLEGLRQENIPCSTSQMISAINGYMGLAYKFYADDDVVMQEGWTVGKWRSFYSQLARSRGYRESEYGGFAYDAVWVYAKALDALFHEDHKHIATLHSDKTSSRYLQLINRTDFVGVSGRVHFVGSSRLSEVVIWQWYNNTTRQIGIYKPDHSAGHLELNETAIVWLTKGGMKPHDGREGEFPSVCPVEWFKSLLGVSCELAIVICNLLGFSLFALMMIMGFFIFKHRYEEKVRRTEARMRQLGLVATHSMLALDGWEMPRDRIVINRKLGEGAFGTVFGGEAFIEDKGWVAVAVKMLKVGATIEEKLDFLGEAEMMKRFDHKNVVRLIGVCTVGAPIYTVMEFMLYGDLKTYLLARRDLVNDNSCQKSEEVSNERLTKMALDIARGLSYLADLKYVHRDLACRNCLVNANRTVKIADFGMCRPMYDSDYYKFTKRGMLPVRWMAPESLIDGIFTPLSDVWSYGVLLYEVITFGSFPYQGLSNNQVLEYVKNYNHLQVPKGCKPELEGLLNRCWERNPHDRPAACEIVEYIAQRPNLISPCLDLPLASVEVEDTCSIELAIHERGRMHSVSSVNNNICLRTKEPEVLPRQTSFGSLVFGRDDTSPPKVLMTDSPTVSRPKSFLPLRGQYVTLQHQRDLMGEGSYPNELSKLNLHSVTSL